MTKSPCFQFYPDDFVGGRPGMMTPEEVGVYTLLLCADWNQNGFVFDPKPLSRWCRTSTRKFLKAWAVVRENFVARGGRMYNPRLEIERAKQQAWKEKSSKGGVKGGGSNRATTLATTEQPKSNIPLPLPLPVVPTTTTSVSQSAAREADAPTQHREAEVRFLDALPVQAIVQWQCEIRGWPDGLNMPQPVPTQAEIEQGLSDYLLDTMPPKVRTFNPVHVRSYVSRLVRKRSQPEERGPPNGRRRPFERETIFDANMRRVRESGFLDDVEPETEGAT